MAAIDEHPNYLLSMGERSRQHTETQPPWEGERISVPFLKPGSTSLSDAERQISTDQWANRERERTGRRQDRRDDYVRDSQNGSGPMSPYEQEDGRARTPLAAEPWTAPRAAPPPPLPPAPYGSPKTPQSPKSASEIPSFVKIPSSPPLSGRSWDSTRSFGNLPRQVEESRQSEPTITAFPGTMSAREKTESRRKLPRSVSVDAAMPVENKKDSPSFGRRFKSALKDMFKRDPVDDSNLERIGNRHWTEDEY